MGLIAIALFQIFYTPNLDEKNVAYVLVGGVQPRSSVVAFKTFKEAKVRAVVSTDAIAYASPKFSDYVETTSDTDYLGKVELDSLQPGTTYYYQLEVNDSVGVFDGYSGTFTTPQEGAFSYKMVFGACAKSGSNSSIFTQLTNEDALLYLNVGDLHYGNIDRNCEENFSQEYYRVFTASNRNKLHRSTAFAYMWDDHDYGDNNSTKESSCRPVAMQAYKSYIPHYDLALSQEAAPLSQSFTIGRLRFLLTDLRSHKIPPRYDGCERIKVGTNFGTEEHLSWFKQEMLEAKRSGQMVVWVSGIPFINDVGGPNYECDEDDDWGGFPEERADIAQFVEQNDIPACILAGDAHMVAIDDGTNSGYGAVKGKGIPVFQAAPLDRYGSYKGGPYSHGYNAEKGQYGLMEVTDDGGNEICIRWTAKNKEGAIVQNGEGQPIVYEFCREVKGSASPAL